MIPKPETLAKNPGADLVFQHSTHVEIQDLTRGADWLAMTGRRDGRPSSGDEI
jgi:hypothetical protein